jgi:hypothetical protein
VRHGKNRVAATGIPAADHEFMQFRVAAEDLHPFDFVRMRHRSILLLDEAELCELIATVFPAMERHRRFSEEDIGKYVASRLDAGDEEWATLCAKTKRKAWGELASTYRTPRRAGNHEETQVSLDSLFARAATAEEPAEARPTATTAREPEQTSDE